MTRRVVVDTNVLVSGLLTSRPDSPTCRIVDRMLAGELRIVLSETLLGEYRAVLLRPSIARLHGLEESAVDEVLIRLVEHAVLVDAHGNARGIDARDDEHLFAILDRVEDAILVTGDAAAAKRAGTRGRSPRQLLDEEG